MKAPELKLIAWRGALHFTTGCHALFRFARRTAIGVLASLVAGLSLDCAPIEAQQFGAAPPPAAAPLPAGRIAPAITSRTLAGEPFRLSRLRGHVVVLDFWATWCVSCKQAMPALDKLSRDYAPRNVRVIGVSLDDPSTAACVPVTVKRLGVRYPILVGPSRNIAVGQAYNADVLPCLYVVDQAGIVRWSHSGVYADEDKEERGVIDSLLRRSPRISAKARS